MKIIHILLIVCFWHVTVFAQSSDSLKSNVNGSLQFEGGFMSNSQVPFWFRSNTFGSLPNEGLGLSILSAVEKKYVPGIKLFDWGYGGEIRANIGEDPRISFIEAYGKARVGKIQLKVGRSKDITGLIDTTLSSGSFSMSGNALGIPKVELSTLDYLTVPFTSDLLSFKAKISHGWMGKLPIKYSKSTVDEAKSYFHETSFITRLGRPDWRLKLYAGINHEVIWGSDDLIFGEQYTLNQAEAFFYVITGKKYRKKGDISKIGNHLGSLDFKIDYDFDKVQLSLYRQQFYEKGAIKYLANIADGLTGLSIKNVDVSSFKNTYWRKLLLEVFYSKDQAGEGDAKWTPSGPEYYYNHAVYASGYSYKGLGLGNPLITPVRFARQDLPNAPLNYFINNRVFALHLGSTGRVIGLDYLVKLTYSKNWGDYRTSNIGYWFDGDWFEREPSYGIFRPVSQFSGYFDLSKRFKNSYAVGIAMGGDCGKLLNNSFGGQLKVSKRW